MWILFWPEWCVIIGVITITLLLLGANYEKKKGHKDGVRLCLGLAVGVVILMGLSMLMPPPPPPQPEIYSVEAMESASVDAEPLSEITDQDTQIIVRVLNTKNQPIKGVSVIAEGPNNAFDSATTNSDGFATLELNPAPTLPTGVYHDVISIEATYKGITVTTTVTVVQN
jgi:hypothetical protein